MKKSILFLLAAVALCGGAANANDLSYDTSDPLFMPATRDVLSRTTLSYWDDVLRLGQTLAYGFNDRLAAGANVHYQFDFDGDEDGFSSIDVGGIYRLATANDNSARIISDVILGLKFGGSSHVRTPYYADSTYYAGLRFGRQWAAMTLAATIRASWIFDDDRGMSYIDFMPAAYFRLTRDWKIGADFTWRKSTNPYYDQEWIGGKIVRQYGRTQYIGHVDYEFESGDVQFGGRVNILF